MIEELIERFRHKDRQALSRLLTLISYGEFTQEILAAFPFSKSAESARVIALTGNSGVGKSTLTGKLIHQLREKDLTVAVLACDPQSALTGGALLGDRVRMPFDATDSGVMIRSLATSSGQQAVAEHLDLMIHLLKTFGFDMIVLETVGAGQGDIAVRQFAQVVVLLLQPEIGDSLQWEKAGVLEVADIVVIHKGDLAGSNRTESQVRDYLNIPGCREIPVLRVSALKNQGLQELWNSIEAAFTQESTLDQDPQMLLRAAQRELAERFRQKNEQLSPLIDQWKRQELNEDQAAEQLLQMLIQA